MNTLWKLENTIQPYAWGNTTYLADLLDLDDRTTPKAEMWMGDHPKAPSGVPALNSDLNKLIRDNREFAIGAHLAAEYDGLPFLFKVLCAGTALSIQVHPTIDQAEAGFARENKKNIAMDAYERTYKDANHKPEIVCALTPYTAMKGFRAIGVIRSHWKKAGLSGINHSLDHTLEVGDLKGFVITLLSLGEGDKKSLLSVIPSLRDSGIDSFTAGWVTRLSGLYPGDVAALAPLYLNLHLLQPGEAVFLEAGVMHAYLEGVGMELMANSDNVIRGGLTPKFIDLDEMAEVVKFETDSGQKMPPAEEGNCWGVYKTPFREFELARLKSTEADQTEEPGIPRIFICIEGRFTLTRGEEELILEKGDSCFATAAGEVLKVKGRGEIYRAGVPGQ